MHCLGIGQIRSIRTSQQPGQISVGIQAVLNGCLDQAEHNCAASGTLGGIAKQEVLPVNNEGLNAPLVAETGLEPAVSGL